MKKILLIIWGLYITGAVAQVTYNGPALGSVPAGETVNTNDFNTSTSRPPSGVNLINHFEPEVPEMYIQPNNAQTAKRTFFYLSDNIFCFKFDSWFFIHR